MAHDGSAVAWVSVKTRGHAPSARFHHTTTSFDGELLIANSNALCSCFLPLCLLPCSFCLVFSALGFVSFAGVLLCILPSVLQASPIMHQTGFDHKQQSPLRAASTPKVACTCEHTICNSVVHCVMTILKALCLSLAPCALWHVPYSLCVVPCALWHVPYALCLTPCVLWPMPCNLGCTAFVQMPMHGRKCMGNAQDINTTFHCNS